MRILYDGEIYATQAIGGISRYFANLISRLPKSYKPTVTAIQRTAITYPKHPQVRVLKYKRFRINQLSFALEKAYFRSLLSFSTFDVAHPTYYSLLTQKELSDYACPVVVTVHDMIHERFAKSTDAVDSMIAIKRKAILAAQAIICVSQNTKNDLLEYYSIPEAKITVTHLASELDISLSDGDEPVPAKPYFLYVGSRLYYKNFDGLLKAFAKAVSIQTDIHLCVVGPAFSASEQDLIATLQLSDRVTHYGFISDRHLAKLYRCSLAFVYPSFYEGFGIPPLEAMACGAPVIAANSSSIPEVVGDAGLLFDPTSVEDLADHLLFLAEHPIERDRLIAKGHERTKLFSWDKTAAQTFEVYQSVAH